MCSNMAYSCNRKQLVYQATQTHDEMCNTEKKINCQLPAEAPQFLPIDAHCTGDASIRTESENHQPVDLREELSISDTASKSKTKMEIKQSVACPATLPLLNVASIGSSGSRETAMKQPIQLPGALLPSPCSQVSVNGEKTLNATPFSVKFEVRRLPFEKVCASTARCHSAHIPPPEMPPRYLVPMTGPIPGISESRKGKARITHQPPTESPLVLLPVPGPSICTQSNQGMVSSFYKFRLVFAAFFTYC